MSSCHAPVSGRRTNTAKAVDGNTQLLCGEGLLVAIALGLQRSIQAEQLYCTESRPDPQKHSWRLAAFDVGAHTALSCVLTRSAHEPLLCTHAKPQIMSQSTTSGSARAWIVAADTARTLCWSQVTSLLTARDWLH